MPSAVSWLPSLPAAACSSKQMMSSQSPLNVQCPSIPHHTKRPRPTSQQGMAHPATHHQPYLGLFAALVC
jgi:hypothetical protein